MFSGKPFQTRACDIGCDCVRRAVYIIMKDFFGSVVLRIYRPVGVRELLDDRAKGVRIRFPLRREHKRRGLLGECFPVTENPRKLACSDLVPARAVLRPAGSKKGSCPTDTFRPCWGKKK